MGITVVPLLGLGNLNLAEGLQSPRLRLLMRTGGVQSDCLFNLSADLHYRVKAGHRLLEDHRQFRTPQLSQLPFRQTGELKPIQQDRSAGNPTG